MTTNPPRIRPFLRQYADQPLTQLEAVREARQDLEDLGPAPVEAEPAADEHADERMRLHGALSEAYRQLGHLDPAVGHAEQALAFAIALDEEKARITSLLRLATALQYRNEHARALPLFEEALTRARARGFLVDFVLQHQGKALVELGERERALADFEEALALRRSRGDAALVASTEEAIAAVATYKPLR